MLSLPTSYSELVSRVTAGGTREVFDPATEELIGLAPEQGTDVLDQLVTKAPKSSL